MWTEPKESSPVHHHAMKDANRQVPAFMVMGLADGHPRSSPQPEASSITYELTHGMPFCIEARLLLDGRGPDRGTTHDGCATRPVLMISMSPPCPCTSAGMSMQQLVAKGRKDINEIDKTLERAERIAEDTKAVGKEVGTMECDMGGAARRGVHARAQIGGMDGRGKGRYDSACTVPAGPVLPCCQLAGQGERTLRAYLRRVSG